MSNINVLKERLLVKLDNMIDITTNELKEAIEEEKKIHEESPSCMCYLVSPKQDELFGYISLKQRITIELNVLDDDIPDIINICINIMSEKELINLIEHFIISSCITKKTLLQKVISEIKGHYRN